MALGAALYFALHTQSNGVQNPPDQEQIPEGLRTHVAAELPVPGQEGATVNIFHEFEPLQLSKISPKNDWEFRFATNGLVKFPDQNTSNLRFRVFAQSRKSTHDDIAQWSTRMLLRLWSYNYYRLGRDHYEPYRKLVDVYLCFGGDAGGEHLFDVDSGDLDSNNRPVKVNTMYIYQVGMLQDPFQLARELAHEYGHATLPAVGIYNKPENWANGDIGERIYLNWLLQDIKAGNLFPRDAVNVEVKKLEKYVKERVEPLVADIARTGPDQDLLAQKIKTEKKDDEPGTETLTEAAFNEYVALATYAANVLPPKKFNRAMELGGQNAKKFAEALVDVAEEGSEWSLDIPEYLAGKAIYLPIGNKKFEGAKFLQKKGDWVKVQPLEAKITFSDATTKSGGK